jgi:hypothetical protein
MSDMRWMERAGSADTLNAAVIYRNLKDQEENPNRRFVDSMKLRESTRMGIVVSHSEIIDQNTGEVHHHAVKIECIPKIAARNGGGWSLEKPKTIWIDDGEKDEIRRLRDFLSVVRGGMPEAVGRYLIVHLDEGHDASDALHGLIQHASGPGKAEALIRVIEAVGSDTEAFNRLIDLAATNPVAAEVMTAALNIARYRDSFATLEELIEGNATEWDFQSHLESNDWLFGSEYSELLDLRHATRDEHQDFIVRRTTDEYIEIIEIKRPLNGQSLFNYDRSHDCYYPSSPLSQVVGQVINYIEQLDAERESLLRRNGLDTNKIRAKIIIGRNGDDSQLQALRNFNGHLHRIEIVTFDQLLNIGRRVLGHLESVITQEHTEGSPVASPWHDEEPPF